MSSLSWLLVLLASLRSFQLVTRDDITRPFRDWLFERKFMWHEDESPTTWTDAFDCPSCLGYWLTLGWTVTGVLWADTTLWLIAAGSWCLCRNG